MTTSPLDRRTECADHLLVARPARSTPRPPRTPPTLGRVWPLRDVIELDKTLSVCGIVSVLSILAAVAAPKGSEPVAATRPAACAPLLEPVASPLSAETSLHAGALLACRARP